MHAIKGGWSGQVFALATSNDSGVRKSRIRRSKEERKALVESFIKTYQKSNNGNFPSLNLTHKEVGGSFYTVREIVREVIQENRVLAPPKVSLEEQKYSAFLEQHPLGSISVEPQINVLDSDRIHRETHSATDKYQIAGEDNVSSSSMEFRESSPVESSNEQITGVSDMVQREEISDGTSGSHSSSNHYQEMSFEEVSNWREQSSHLKKSVNGMVVNGIEVLGGNPRSDSDKLETADDGDSVLQGHVEEQLFHVTTDQIVDKAREFRQRIFPEAEFDEVLDTEKYGTKDVDALQDDASHENSDIEVEKFPLRPVPWKIHEMDTQHRISADFIDEKDEKELMNSTMKSKGEFEDEKMVLNLQDHSLECLKDSIASESSVLNVDGVTNAEPNKSFPDGTKINSSSKHLNSKNTTSVGRKFNDPDNSSNRTTYRNNLETSTQSSRPEDNPLVAFLKEMFSSFMKFWTT